jgi:hypothetical protein
LRGLAEIRGVRDGCASGDGVHTRLSRRHDLDERPSRDFPPEGDFGRVAVAVAVPMEKRPACGERRLAWNVAARPDETPTAMLASGVEAATRHFDDGTATCAGRDRGARLASCSWSEAPRSSAIG